MESCLDSVAAAWLAIRLVVSEGHSALDRAQPTRALEAYTDCLEARRKLVDASGPTIANVLDSVACAPVKINNLAKAFTGLEAALMMMDVGL